MKKLIRTLQILDKKEFSRLVTYMRSPYCCSHAATLQLFHYVEPHYPEFANVGFQEYKSSGGPSDLTRSDFALHCSYLLQKVYGFLAAEEHNSHSVTVALDLMRSLLRRGEYQEVHRQIGLARKQLSARVPLESHNYLLWVQLQEIQLELTLAEQMQGGFHPLDEYFNSLDHLYVGLQVKYLLPAHTIHLVAGRSFPRERWQFVERTIANFSESAQPLSRIFFQLLKLLRQNSPDLFRQLIHLLDQYGQRLATNERINVYGYLQNYLTLKQSQGDPDALVHLFALYQRMERENLIFGHGDFTEHLVRNIIITGARLGHLEWTGQFLNGHETAIRESAGSNVYAYCMAFYLFYTGEYSQALRHLQQVRFTDAYYRTGHQTLLLRIYYELDDIESLEGLAQTFRRYLNRSTNLSEHRKELNRRFIAVVQLLARARETGMTAYRRRRINQHLQHESGVTDRTWLAAKYRELLEK